MEDPEYWNRLTLWVRKDSSALSPAKRAVARRELAKLEVEHERLPKYVAVRNSEAIVADM